MKKSRLIVIGLCIAGMAGVGFAQSTTQVTSSSVKAKIADVPDSEKIQRTRDAIDKMRRALTKVLGFLEEARDQSDVLKLNCVNEKLTAIKGLLRVAEQADVAMQEGLARGDTTRARHNFEKVVTAERKVDDLKAESEACVGESMTYSGRETVTVEVGGKVVYSRGGDSGDGQAARGGGFSRGGSERDEGSTAESTEDTSAADDITDSHQQDAGAGTVLTSPEVEESSEEADADSGSGTQTGGSDDLSDIVISETDATTGSSDGAPTN